MATPSYVVIRLVPAAPVDGGTFSTYLDGLTIQIFDKTSGLPLSDTVFSSLLSLYQWPPGANPGYAAVSVPTSAATDYNSGSCGHTLQFNSTDGIAVGAYVFSADQNAANPAIPYTAGLTVVDVKQGSVTLNSNLSNYVPAGSVVSFGTYKGADPLSPGVASPSFSLTPSGPATTLDSGTGSVLDVLHFSDTSGVTVGMAVGPAVAETGGLIAIPAAVYVGGKANAQMNARRLAEIEREYDRDCKR